jgi:UDP-N-acetylglucosamine--N-acetylmuramyl-(pentapeptide) pyrophosphoryl-undecaprenol N-acetylglucosamine transferase
MIAGGGTGGHLTPALAVAQALQSADPGGEVLFVSRRDGVGEELITAAGLRLETIAVHGLDASRPGTVVRALWQLPLGIVRAWRLIRAFRPGVVVGTAGYVCVPVVVAARMARVPVVLLEQNAVPGRAIRLMARHARTVALSYSGTAALLPRARTVHTGNPVRLGDIPPPPLGDSPRHLLVTGGSQGARRLNRALTGILGGLLERHPDLTVTHQCGEADLEWVLAAARSLPPALRNRHVVQSFFLDLLDRMREADLVVMRAGGSSLAECSALGRPMILVPYPHAGAHQWDNARPYAEAGAAVVIPDEECDGPRLEGEIERILTAPDRWRAMAEASAASGRPGAATRVVELIREAAAA